MCYYSIIRMDFNNRSGYKKFTTWEIFTLTTSVYHQPHYRYEESFRKKYETKATSRPVKYISRFIKKSSNCWIRPLASIHWAAGCLIANSREVSKHRDWVYTDRVALKFDRHLGSAAAEVPVNFVNECKSLNPILAASRLHEFLR